MKNNVILALIPLCLLGCSSSEPRKPKKHSTSNFYKEVIENNKNLNNLEKKQIVFFLSKDTINNYHVSSNGFWYTYIKKDTINTSTPAKGNLVTLTYNIMDFDGRVIYENQTINYRVDKEDFIPALQEGIKLMKKGEIVTFVIPSYRAFGVTGDGNKIGISQTIKSNLTLIDIKK